MRARGFTLIEMLFAVAIMAVLAVAALGFFENFNQQARKTTELGRADSAFRSFGQKFLGQLQAADAAVAFQRLPVPVGGCGNGDDQDGPCLLKLDAEEKLVAAESSLVGNATSVDFFADRSGSLSTRSLGDAASGLILRYGKPLDLSQMRARKERVYATWRLKDETSKPFVMMTRTRGADYFNFVGALAYSSPSNRWVPWTGARPDINVQSLVGGLLAVYNGYDTRQYFVQRVVNAINCTNQLSNCKTRLGLAASDTNLNTNAYALELENLTVEAINLSRYMPAVAAASSWGAQAAALYMFPTLTASLEDAANTDFATPIHVRRLQHYFNSKNQKAQFMAVPIELHSYFLKNKGKRRVLLRQTYPSSQAVVMLEDIGPQKTENNGSQPTVVFARLLGTSNVSVMLYEKAKP